jgi:hypothetical protein
MSSVVSRDAVSVSPNSLRKTTWLFRDVSANPNQSPRRTNWRITDANRLLQPHLPLRLNAMLEARQLTVAVPELDTPLLLMHPDHLAHRWTVTWSQTESTHFWTLWQRPAKLAPAAESSQISRPFGEKCFTWCGSREMPIQHRVFADSRRSTWIKVRLFKCIVNSPAPALKIRPEDEPQLIEIWMKLTSLSPRLHPIRSVSGLMRPVHSKPSANGPADH